MIKKNNFSLVIEFMPIVLTESELLLFNKSESKQGAYHARFRINAYQNTMRVVMRIAADRAFAAAGTDPEVTEIIRVLVVVHSQADAQLTASVTALLHHLREGFVPTTLTVVLL